MSPQYSPKRLVARDVRAVRRSTDYYVTLRFADGSSVERRYNAAGFPVDVTRVFAAH